MYAYYREGDFQNAVSTISRYLEIQASVLPLGDRVRLIEQAAILLSVTFNPQLTAIPNFLCIFGEELVEVGEDTYRLTYPIKKSKTNSQFLELMQQFNLLILD